MNILLCLGKETPLRPHYAQKLQEHGMNAIVARYGEPWSEKLDAIRGTYGQCQGVLLTGGSDIDPLRYGMSAAPEMTKDVDTGRDTLDLTVLDWAYRDKKPVLGICRGAQIIGVHRGLRLIQHIPDYCSTMIERHSKEELPRTLEAITENLIWLSDGSRIRRIIGSQILLVKCAHHQAIEDKPNRYLRISAYSSFGIPEAWEGLDPEHFCIGTQFHPEISSGPTDNLFLAFAQASSTYNSQFNKSRQ